MQRNTTALADGEFDVLIIGGGAFGAAAARDAALRGLRTALIERADFGGGASAECFKMVHGGIRYLQHADIPRLRASCRERSALLRIAPHLVQPLPIAIPTYGYGRRGRAFLGAGACAYDLLTVGRNAGIARSRTPDPTHAGFFRATEVLAHFPHLRAPDLSGAVVFEDGQMYNPARLVLAFVKGAVAAGATACNYVEAQRFVWDGDAVRGVRVRDHLSGDTFDVRARLTLNAAGPWADYLQHDPERFGALRPRPVLAGRLLHRGPPPDQRIRRRRAGPQSRQGRSARPLDAPSVRRAVARQDAVRRMASPLSGAAGRRSRRARGNRPLDRRTELGLSGTAARSVGSYVRELRSGSVRRDGDRDGAEFRKGIAHR